MYKEDREKGGESNKYDSVLLGRAQEDSEVEVDKVQVEDETENTTSTKIQRWGGHEVQPRSK